MPKRPVQAPLSFSRRGGARLGAGRPRKRGGGVSHQPRPQFVRRAPVHATLRVRQAIPSLRGARCFSAVERALAAARDRLGIRVIHFSVLGNHLHLIVEADSSAALSRGMQGLSIRLAKGINAALGRRGGVFADHYHSRLLSTPTEVVNAIRYVLDNHLHHFPERAGSSDPCSSALRPDLAAAPRTWLLTIGWRRGRRMGPARQAAAATAAAIARN